VLILQNAPTATAPSLGFWPNPVIARFRRRLYGGLSHVGLNGLLRVSTGHFGYRLDIRD
jgi:hypothetical protein